MNDFFHVDMNFLSSYKIFEGMYMILREGGIKSNRFSKVFRNADAETVQTIFLEYLRDTVSIPDAAAQKDLKENFYKSLVL